jgi:hypothetical protein
MICKKFKNSVTPKEIDTLTPVHKNAITPLKERYFTQIPQTSPYTFISVPTKYHLSQWTTHSSMDTLQCPLGNIQNNPFQKYSTKDE